MGSSPIFIIYVTEYGVVGSVSVLGIEGHVFKSHYSDLFIFLKMQTLSLLHSFLLVVLTFSSIMVFFSYNPIYSVLFLILSFLSASSILVLFGAEFLAVLFLIIYVGAIAILFLFVVMMLNIKFYVPNQLVQLPVIFIISIIVFLQSFWGNDLFYNTFKLEITNTIYIENLSNIDFFGQVLFNYFLVGVLLAGLILLIALIGSIILTLNFKTQRKPEVVGRQLSRSDTLMFKS